MASLAAKPTLAKLSKTPEGFTGTLMLLKVNGNSDKRGLGNGGSSNQQKKWKHPAVKQSYRALILFQHCGTLKAQQWRNTITTEASYRFHGKKNVP